ncbi:MAG: hypothetical protein ACKVZJ_03930 [Phycisphaerales bacterium]
MASRTSSSTGMLVGLSVFALLSLVFFVLTVVFLARSQRLENDLATARNDLAVAVKPDERDDRWEEIKRQASGGGGAGAVRFLDQGLSETMRLVTGNRKDTAETFQKKMTEMFGETPAPLMTTLGERNKQIEDLKAQLAAAQAAQASAENDLKASSDRLAKVQDEQRNTVNALNAEIGGYKAELDRYRGSVETTQSSMEERVSTLRAESDKTTGELEGKVDSLQQELLIKQEQLDKALGKNDAARLRPGEESALVDARIVATNPAAKQVYIGVGRRQNAVLGMSFEVYSAGTAITPDEEGNYPPGKAAIEIVRVEENSSLARLTRETRGQPVIQGDAVANAVYDPTKKYTFAVFGSFDTNGDDVATPQEAVDIETMIKDWGGLVSDGITGNTDFLVLGSRPVLPPEPKPDDPIEIIQRYLRLKQNAQKYDELFEAAKRTSIPILNQNRLMTLTGLAVQR